MTQCIGLPAINAAENLKESMEEMMLSHHTLLLLLQNNFRQSNVIANNFQNISWQFPLQYVMNLMYIVLPVITFGKPACIGKICKF